MQLEANVFASALNLDEAQAQQVSNVLGGLYSPDFEHATAEERKATAQLTYDSLLNSLIERFFARPDPRIAREKHGKRRVA